MRGEVLILVNIPNSHFLLSLMEWLVLLYSSTQCTNLDLINANLILLLSQQDNLQSPCNSQIKEYLILNGRARVFLGKIYINQFNPLNHIDPSMTPGNTFVILQNLTKGGTKFKLLTFELRIWLDECFLFVDECTHADNLNLSAQGRSFNSSLAFHFRQTLIIKTLS